MRSFKNLERMCHEGIPFSKCRESIMRSKTKKKTSRSPSRKRKRKDRSKKRPLKRQTPPKGVIIRKNNMFYRSNGKTLQPLVHK